MARLLTNRQRYALALDIALSIALITWAYTTRGTR